MNGGGVIGDVSKVVLIPLVLAKILVVSLPASVSEALRNLLVVIGPVASSSTTIPKLVGTPRVAVTTIMSDAGSAVLAEIIDLLVDNFVEGSVFNPESAFVALLAEVEFPVAVFVPAAGAVPAG
jgi:hypothetical protein